MDGRLKRPFEGSQGSCHFKNIFCESYKRRKDGSDLSRGKGSAACGTKGRVDPVDLRETILSRTPLDLLLRIFRSRGTVGEEQTGTLRVEIPWLTPVRARLRLPASRRRRANLTAGWTVEIKMEGLAFQEKKGKRREPLSRLP